MKRSLAFFLFLFSLTLVSQTNQALRVFSFDELSKKPLSCDHYYCSDNNKGYKIVSLDRSAWFFEKEKGSHFLIDYKKFSHIKFAKKGYMPELFMADQMKKPNDTAYIYLKKIHKDFNYNFKNIVFKEDLTVDMDASKFSIHLYKDYLLAKDPRLKILIVNVNCKYVISSDDKVKAAYNLKKLLGADDRISIKINNAVLPSGNNEVTFSVLELSE